MRYILAVDPGKMTGVSFFSWDGWNDPVLEWSAEVDSSQYAHPIRYALANYQDVEVVCERFVINAKTVQNSQAPFSLEQIGVLKQIMRDYDIDPDTIHFQSPADAKGMFPNPKLKKLGYWHRGGAGHALDSMRHGLLRLAKSGWAPKGLLS